MSVAFKPIFVVVSFAAFGTLGAFAFGLEEVVFGLFGGDAMLSLLG